MILSKSKGLYLRIPLLRPPGSLGQMQALTDVCFAFPYSNIATENPPSWVNVTSHLQKGKINPYQNSRKFRVGEIMQKISLHNFLGGGFKCFFPPRFLRK